MIIKEVEDRLTEMTKAMPNSHERNNQVSLLRPVLMRKFRKANPAIFEARCRAWKATQLDNAPSSKRGSFRDACASMEQGVTRWY